MLKTTFTKLLEKFSDNNDITNKIWNKIEQNYSSEERYYHTLKHLENLLSQLSEVKNKINDWNTILFSLYYHDIIYNVRKSNNEEQSAIFAQKQMKLIKIPANIIKNCSNQILATKKHLKSTDNDTNFFLDADISILGFDKKDYFEYTQNIRQEYSIFSDKIYYHGRRKVIKHFLKMGKIYKTNYFYKKLETQAKQNLKKELETIQNK